MERGDGKPKKEETPFHETWQGRWEIAEAPWERDGNVRGRTRGRQMPGGETGIIRTLVEQDNDYVLRERGGRGGRAGGPHAAPRVFLTRFIQRARCFSIPQTWNNAE